MRMIAALAWLALLVALWAKYSPGAEWLWRADSGVLLDASEPPQWCWQEVEP